jgi:hypothetical protein
MSQVKVLGTWSSQWGPVTLTGSPDHLSGHWDQQEGRGQITAGMFNSATGVLVYAYYQPWNDQHGAAAFLVAATGQFTGNYVQQDGNNGPWNLARNIID